MNGEQHRFHIESSHTHKYDPQSMILTTTTISSFMTPAPKPYEGNTDF